MNICKDCKYHELVNEQMPQVRVCHQPDHAVDGKAPACVQTRRDCGTLKDDCPEFEEVEVGDEG